MDHILIYGLGFLSQVLFFARNIAQWFLSEKEGEVISPAVYWQISLAASILMFIYGVLRNDFAIVLGQIIVYMIYIRNLQLKKVWHKMHVAARLLAVVIPLICVSWLFWGESYNFSSMLKNENVPLLLLIWGSAGQVIFTFRFIYQWIYSEQRKDSFLPLGFWVISTIGSLMIFTYAIYRLDPVLFAAHSLGLFIYIRNILLHSGRGSISRKLEKVPYFNKIIDKIADKMK
ncbi:MAG TPA: lauroyl acyltransferase [Mariniphaga anaerophila]|uniref:Lauroyl acyltransferase n=1 Tax=Mariniphaga anaerophila TaxID=1484053 RepID=A0A831LBK6_9BACT|nr:lauroyl acyltransferase [Mariniphaga anaerophila]